jgi:hypothetical protein
MQNNGTQLASMKDVQDMSNIWTPTALKTKDFSEMLTPERYGLMEVCEWIGMLENRSPRYVKS